MIHAVCITDGGGGACMPCVLLEASIADGELGKHIAHVLRASAEVPLPDDFDREWRKVLKVAGVSSWRRLSDGALCCSISQRNGVISITPTKRDKHGFAGLPSSHVEIPADASSQLIGAAIREAWGRSS